MAAPPKPTPPEPEQQADTTAASRLLRAQSAELAALRKRLEGVPDPEDLAALRQKAERFDALSQTLPQLQQQVAGLFRQQQAAVDAQRLQTAISAAFVEAGGLPAWSAPFAELHVQKASLDSSGQVVMSGTDGTPKPIAQVLEQLRVDGQWSHTFKPMYGSGSGMTPAHDPRIAHGPDLSRLNTSQKFDLAFGGNQ